MRCSILRTSEFEQSQDSRSFPTGAVCTCLFDFVYGFCFAVYGDEINDHKQTNQSKNFGITINLGLFTFAIGGSAFRVHILLALGWSLGTGFVGDGCAVSMQL